MSLLQLKTVGKATVIVDIVRKGNPEVRPAYHMNPTQIAIHNTGNAGRGAGAKAHNTYIHNQSRLPVKDTRHASWHFSVDDKYIYQHIPMNESAWHTGDGSGSTSGNRTAIGIEICENVDMNYAQAEENAIALAVHLMRLYSVPIGRVKSHQQFNGKYCPRVILNRDGSFTPFRNRIEKAYFNDSNNGGSKVKMYKPTTREGANATLRVLSRFERKENNPLSPIHRDAFKDGEMTESHAIEMLFVAIDRGYITVN